MDKVKIKTDHRIDYLMIEQQGSNTSTGVQITPEIAAQIIAELAKYLLDKTNEN